MHVFAIGMRIFATGFWAMLVNTALVVFAKKNTGRAVKHVVAIDIQVKVFLDKRHGFYIQMIGNSGDVDIPEYGTCGFAAICALQAVDVFKRLFMSPVKNFVDFPRLPAFKIPEKFFVLLAVAYSEFQMITISFIHVDC